MKTANFAVLVAIASLSTACGDIIRMRNPLKKDYPPERLIEVKDFTNGNCPSFNGYWQGQCISRDGVKSDFTMDIYHGNCRTFTLNQRYAFDTNLLTENTANLDGTTVPVTTEASWGLERKNLTMKISEQFPSSLRTTKYVLERIDWDHVSVAVTGHQRPELEKELTCKLVWHVGP